jgi:nucleotide sugar dehydrogenase
VPGDGSAVAVVGSGYVGTVVAACLAWLGQTVVAVEADGARVAALSQGKVPFHEPGLDEVVASAVASGRLRVTSDVGRALDSAEIVFLCLGTPAGNKGGADLRAFETATQAIGTKADGHHIIVVKSTVPVGSSQMIKAWCEAAATETGRSSHPTFTIVSNPEFMREGSAVEDFLHPDRVVVGGEDECSLDRVAELYRPILEQNFAGAGHGRRPVLIRTTSATAEMIKYAANAFLATKVSFINEIANICDSIDADVVEVSRGIGLDHRIGASYLDAGLGWGGSCLGKDLAALISHAKEHGYEPELLRATLGVNARRRSQVVERLRQRLGALTEKRVALLGLAFKPGTDDLRDAPAVGIARELIDAGSTVTAYDPSVLRVPEACGLSLAASAYDAVEQADAVVIATQWPEFLELDFEKLRARMRGTMLLDGRNCVDANAVAASGLSYQGTGHFVRPRSGVMSTQVRADGQRSGAVGAAALRFQSASPNVSLGMRSTRRVAVTGGAGFLGYHLCEALLARGDRVVCIDNLSTGTAENVRDLAELEGFEFVMADASTPLPVDGPVDAVLHFASPASPTAYLARPLETLAVGSQGTRQALALASEHNARFLLASTSEVYGDPEVHPQTESYWGHVNPVGPRSVYDESKRFAEALTTAWARTHRVENAIVRIFNTYGPRLQPGDGRVVSNFLVQAVAGRPLTVYGSGSQSRSLCYVDDTVRGILALLDSHLAGPVNIGNPAEITVLDLAHKVLELTGSASGIVFAPLPVDDPRHRCPDISLARRTLNWEPGISLREGLQRTLEYFVSRTTPTTAGTATPAGLGG